MADAAAYANRPPGGNAYGPVWTADSDSAMERKPDNMDARTGDVVSDQSRLGGARALPNLKERGA